MHVVSCWSGHIIDILRICERDVFESFCKVVLAQAVLLVITSKSHISFLVKSECKNRIGSFCFQSCFYMYLFFHLKWATFLPSPGRSQNHSGIVHFHNLNGVILWSLLFFYFFFLFSILLRQAAIAFICRKYPLSEY